MRCWHINVLGKTSASSSPNPVWRKTDYFFSACHSFCIGAEGTCYPEWSVDVMPRLKCVADLNDLLMIVPIFSTHVSIMNMDRWIGTHCISSILCILCILSCVLQWTRFIVFGSNTSEFDPSFSQAVLRSSAPGALSQPRRSKTKSHCRHPPRTNKKWTKMN